MGERKTTKQMIEVMQASLEGKRIRRRGLYECDDSWEMIDSEDYVWNWGAFDYEVVPDPPKPREVWIGEFQGMLSTPHAFSSNPGFAWGDDWKFIRFVEATKEDDR